MQQNDEWLFAIRVTFVVTVIACTGAPRARADALPIEPGSWTLAIMPDTQHYVDNPANYANLIAQTQWIKDHAASHNIAMVLQEGDVTQNNDPTEWQRARDGMSILDGFVPYAIAPGNHDYGPGGNTSSRDTLFFDNTYFGPTTPYATQSTFGGAFESDLNRTDNTYHTFSAGGQDWLVLALEFGPRDEVVQWANDVVDAHPGYKAMLVTHAYMYYDDTRYDWASKGASQTWSPYSYGVADLPGGVNDGRNLWERLIYDHEEFAYVFNGHVLSDGTGYLSSMGKEGNVVDQLLANYQFLPNGGDAYMRLLEFKTDGTVEVRTYSPALDAYDTDSDQQFTLVGLNGVVGDLDQDGVLEQVDDLNLFLAGWQSNTEGLNAADKYALGDLDLNGKTDIYDAQRMEAALTAQGLVFSFTPIEIPTPEPSSAALLMLGIALSSLRRLRRAL